MTEIKNVQKIYCFKNNVESVYTCDIITKDKKLVTGTGAKIYTADIFTHSGVDLSLRYFTEANVERETWSEEDKPAQVTAFTPEGKKASCDRIKRDYKPDLLDCWVI